VKFHQVSSFVRRCTPARSRDVPFLTDPANPTVIMSTPLTVYRMTTATHTPLIRGGHDADMGAIRHTLPSWEVSTALGPNTFQRWGVQDSLHELIEDPENMCMVSVVPRIDPRAMLIELNPSTYSSNLGKRRASCPSAFYSIAVSKSGFFVRYHVPT
jgi:hypothetical protein